MIQWVKFWLLAVIWGSSFLLIKVGVEDLGALPLVSIRIGGAALLYLIYLKVTHRAFPKERRERYAMFFVGIFNTAVPFFLISWGETRIDSGLATVLNATTPLFGLIFAHFTLADEHLSPSKIVGLLVGFLGVIVIASATIRDGEGSFLGQLAVLAAGASYGICITSVRIFLRKVDAFAVAGWSTVIGGAAVVLATLLLVNPLPTDVSGEAWGAAITLAIVNTFVAYFLFYDLIAKWGARASLITYATPPIGVTLGYLVLDEKIGWQLVVGGILIVGGIFLAKVQPRWRFLMFRRPAPDTTTS